MFPDGVAAKLTADADPREAFATWLITPANPWFTKSIANRVWFWLLGRGIVQEPDDIRPDNPPSHPELLAYLAQELVASHYDVKHLFRLILNSATYQLSSTPAGSGPDDDATFSHYLVRPLDAEVLIDALCQITDTSEQYSSAIPEPYTFLPENTRAIALRGRQHHEPVPRRRSGGRRATPGSSPSARTRRRRPSGCTCSIRATSRRRSSRARRCRRSSAAATCGRPSRCCT